MARRIFHALRAAPQSLAADEPAERCQPLSTSTGIAWVRRSSVTAATTLGVGQAAVSFYWFFGTALLDTVGGSIERWATQRGPLVTTVLATALSLKVVAVILGFAVARGRKGVVRRLTWVAAVILAGYGAVNSVAAQLMLSGRLATPAEATRTAVTWHACVWDPWFMLWGLALIALLVTTGGARAAEAQRSACGGRLAQRVTTIPQE